MKKQKQVEENDGESLSPMPAFDWPKEIAVLTVADLQKQPIYKYIADNFEGEAKAVFQEILLMVMGRYCIYPIVGSLSELSNKYSSADQVELWRRALYIVGYAV